MPVSGSGNRDLTLCPRCGGRFVVPVSWSELDEGWAIALRCGECGKRRDVRLSDAEAERLGQALDLGVTDLALAADALRDDLALQLVVMPSFREPRPGGR